MTQTNTIKCPKCKVDVPVDKIDQPLRCHANCPLNKKDLGQSRSGASETAE